MSLMVTTPKQHLYFFYSQPRLFGKVVLAESSSAAMALKHEAVASASGTTPAANAAGVVGAAHEMLS